MTLFGLLDKSFMRLSSSYFNGFSSMYVLRLLYLFFLVLIYVWNSHYQEKTLHKINQLQPIVDELRVRYMELQSQYMSTIQQSEIAMAIYESKVPPYTIKVKPK